MIRTASLPCLTSLPALALAVACTGCGVTEPRRGAPAGQAQAHGGAQAAAQPAGPWGGSAIRWEDATTGLERARKEGKNALVVVTAEWCPHCRNYANVFADPRVIAEAKSFVMIKLDADRDPQANRFAVDGTYIPRTLFVRSDGTVAPEIHAARPQERYFYDEHDAGPLLAAMAQARR